MKLPMNLRVEHVPRAKALMPIVWSIADHIFKFVGWCLITGLVALAANRTNSMVLRVVAGILELVIFSAVATAFGLRFAGEMPFRIRSRALHTAILILGLLLAVGLTIGGSLMALELIDALANVQSLRSSGQ